MGLKLFIPDQVRNTRHKYNSMICNSCNQVRNSDFSDNTSMWCTFPAGFEASFRYYDCHSWWLQLEGDACLHYEAPSDGDDWRSGTFSWNGRLLLIILCICNIFWITKTMKLKKCWINSWCAIQNTCILLFIEVYIHPRFWCTIILPFLCLRWWGLDWWDTTVRSLMLTRHFMLCKMLSKIAKRARLKRSHQKFLIVLFDCVNCKFLFMFLQTCKL